MTDEELKNLARDILASVLENCDAEDLLEESAK